MAFMQPQLQTEEPAIDTEDAGVAAVNQVEAEIREFVRRDGRHLRRNASTQDTAGEIFATNVNSLVQRVAGTSLREIDNLILELQTLRDTLEAEGERVQRELTNYAQLSQNAMNSIRVNADAMLQLRAQPDNTH